MAVDPNNRGPGKRPASPLGTVLVIVLAVILLLSIVRLVVSALSSVGVQ
jgi:Tfp pilus assembly protein PilX